MNAHWRLRNSFIGLIPFLISFWTGPPALAQDLEFRYVSKNSGQRVYLMSELSFWTPDSRMRLREVRPGEYLLALPQPWLKTLTYKFMVDGNWVSDSENPNRAPDGYGGFNSYLDLSFDEDPELFPSSSTPQSVRSEILLRDTEGDRRKVFLTSPLLKIQGKPEAVVYFQDGGDYLNRAQTEVLLANLSLHPDLPVLHGVFIPPKDRDREYGLTPSSDGYVDFVARTVVSAAEKALGLKVRPTNRLLIGPSLGGVITLYTAFKRPDVFPLAASQSGAMDNATETLFDLIAKAPFGKPEKLFLEIGDYEPAEWIAFTRKAKSAVSTAGIPFRYREYPSTHDWLGWRNRLSEIIGYFFQSGKF